MNARRTARAARSDLAPGALALAEAARALSAVVHEGRSADQALARADAHRERAAIRAIALGAMRWYLRLFPAVATLLARPAGELAPTLQALLAAAAHQIEHSRNPPQSTVHLAVDGARALGQERAAGLVNAVLRRFVAERASIFAELDHDVATRTAHPAWLVAALQRDWPHELERILVGGNAHPPMTLRLDVRRTAVSAYLRELEAAGMRASALAWRPGAIVLERATSVARLPGFSEGRVSVQDAGAQLAAPLLDACAGMRVLDACAAPGGKTGHILEHSPGIAGLVAADGDGLRLEKVRENLARLGREATCVVADLRGREALAEALGTPAASLSFDRILLDAPCSASGVIRRHPDIKLLRRESDIPALAEAQGAILGTCLGLLAPGGRLVYCSCSLLEAENDAVVGRALERSPQIRLAGWPAGVDEPPGSRRTRFGLQLLPGAEAGTDGFYYACLERAAGATA